MAEKLSSLLRSKTGFVGFALFLLGAIRGILSVLQDVDYTREHVGTIADFLQTGAGNLLFMGAGIVLVLWAVFVRQPEKESDATLTNSDSRRLRAELRASEQERKRLQSENKRLRAEIPLPGDEELKQRARQLSDKLFRFARQREESAPPDGPIQVSDTFWGTIKEAIADPRTQERTNYNNETRRQYRDLYGTDVGALLDALELRE